MKEDRPQPPNEGTDRPNKPAVFLDWLPWEKVTIWGLFLLAVYVLRHFFFIIFMTFILAYIARTIISRITSLVGHQERAWLERVLTVVLFALLLFGLYNLGNYFGPRLIAQGEALVGRVTRGVQDNTVEDLKTRIAGPILFSVTYPTEGSENYQQDFAKFVEEEGGRFFTKFETFGSLQSELTHNIEQRLRQKTLSRIAEDLDSSPYSREKDFESWFNDEIAERIYQDNRDHYIQEWQQDFLQALDKAALDEFMAAEGAKTRRDNRIKQKILATIKAEEPEEFSRYRNEWNDSLVTEAIRAHQQRPEYKQEIRDFYLDRKEKDPDRYPYELEEYEKLSDAYEAGEDQFAAVIEQMEPLSPEERLEQNRLDFEAKRERELAETWWSENPFGVQLQEAAKGYMQNGIKEVGIWIQGAIGFLIAFPFQLGLSLLLGFFITFDIPKLRKGLRQLKDSNLSDFYEEIAPGLRNFGRLMGRAFQAQGLIALFNTLLTFISIKFLGIQNEIFLCAIVFVCSFIPVLGVVLSSIPIAVVALVQDGGSIFLSLQIILAILVIHFLETSILNPKILGDMLHLHPVLVLAVLAIGEHFFHIWGLLLGVPVSVYIIRIVILNQGIPGLIEPSGGPGRGTDRAEPGGPSKIAPAPPPSPALPPPSASEGKKKGRTSIGS